MTADDYQRAAGRMRTYAAEDRARLTHPGEALDGTQQAAQAYVDRITRSAWWQRNCPPHWMGDTTKYGTTPSVPSRIIVRATNGVNGRAYTDTVFPYRGKMFPRIELGTREARDRAWAERIGWSVAISDPWVVLHEVAHILATCRDENENGHGLVFRIAYLDLVKRWLGPTAAAALREGYKAERLKFRATRR